MAPSQVEAKMKNPPTNLSSFSTTPLPLRKELLGQERFICVWHRNMPELYPNALGFVDSETIKGPETQAGCSLFPRNQIPEMKPLRKWTQVQNPFGNPQIQSFRLRGSLELPKRV